MPTSPIQATRMGFVPLGNSQSNENMDNQGIPLTTVRSNASSTGARRANQSTATGLEIGKETTNEKHGFFHRGRRKVVKEGVNRRGTGGSDQPSLNAMGRLYTKIIGASVVTRYLVYIVPVAILLGVPLIVIGVIPDGRNKTTGDLIDGTKAADDPSRITESPTIFNVFLWIEITWLMLWAGKVVAHFLPVVFMFFCGVVSSGTRKYATVIKALEIPLSLFFWALAAWLFFKNFFGSKFDVFGWVDAIKKVLGALFVSSAVLLGEKTIVQLISITYHQRSFDNRIKDSKREITLLGIMYDASRTLFPMYCPEFAEEDYIINDSLDLLLSGGKKGGQKKSGSVTPMRLIGEVGRFGDKVTSVFGNIASEITGKKVFNPNSAHSIVIEALEKVRTSEALAKRIWMSFVVEGKEDLSLEDIVEVLGPAHREDAEECFAAIDADSNGDISLDEMIRKVVEIGKERKAITNSMKDIGQALKVFDNILLFVVLLLVVFIFLAFFQSSFITTLATAGTALLSLSFVFAVTTQEFLGSCIFLFVKHPYDVGDRVDIAGSEKEQLVVEKISLLYTVFNRIDKMQIVQIPNIVLNNLWIENVSRSKAMKEVIDLNVSFDTSFEDIELLRVEMEKFVRSTENSRDFLPDLAIGVGGVGDLDKLNLKIAIKHKSNWHNEAVRATRRSKFMCALALALKKVPIYAPGGGAEALGAPGNPSYSVAVSDDFATRARKKADDDKEGLRLVPTMPKRSDSNFSKKSGEPKTAEERAAKSFNTRPAAVEAADDWGYNRDDNTLGSREQSLDRKRSNDIESVRQELIKRESTRRGRRTAGQGIPAAPLGENQPGVQVTPSSPRLATYDEEAEVGGAGAYGGMSMYNQHPQAGYSIFPQGNQGYPPSGQHPLQMAPTTSSTSAQSGRPRGPSVSRSQQGQGNYGQR